MLSLVTSLRVVVAIGGLAHRSRRRAGRLVRLRAIDEGKRQPRAFVLKQPCPSLRGGP
jgi:hypothetical protein